MEHHLRRVESAARMRLLRRADPADIEHRLTQALSSNPSVRWAYLFGSAARGERLSDLDVGVMLSDDARGAVALGRVVSALQAVLPTSTIDVVDLRSLASPVAGRIARDRVHEALCELADLERFAAVAAAIVESPI